MQILVTQITTKVHTITTLSSNIQDTVNFLHSFHLKVLFQDRYIIEATPCRLVVIMEVEGI